MEAGVDSSDLGDRTRRRKERMEGDGFHAQPPAWMASTCLRLGPCVASRRVSHHLDASPLRVVLFAVH